MKKAQGLSMNVIIIAALALLVLVVLSVVFIGKTGKWGADIGKCVTNGGICAAGADRTACEVKGMVYNGVWSCAEETTASVCCIDLTSNGT